MTHVILKCVLSNGDYWIRYVSLQLNLLGNYNWRKLHLILHFNLRLLQSDYKISFSRKSGYNFFFFKFKDIYIIPSTNIPLSSLTEFNHSNFPKSHQQFQVPLWKERKRKRNKLWPTLLLFIYFFYILLKPPSSPSTATT